MGRAGQPRCHLQNGSHGEHTPGAHEESGGHQAHTIRGPVTSGLRKPSQQWPEWHPGSPSHAVQTVSVWRCQGAKQSAATGHSGRRFIQLITGPRMRFLFYVALSCNQAVLCLPILMLLVLFCCHLALSSPPHKHYKHCCWVWTASRPNACFVKWITYSELISTIRTKVNSSLQPHVYMHKEQIRIQIYRKKNTDLDNKWCFYV